MLPRWYYHAVLTSSRSKLELIETRGLPADNIEVDAVNSVFYFASAAFLYQGYLEDFSFRKIFDMSGSAPPFGHSETFPTNDVSFIHGYPRTNMKKMLIVYGAAKAVIVLDIEKNRTS